MPSDGKGVCVAVVSAELRGEKNLLRGCSEIGAWYGARKRFPGLGIRSRAARDGICRSWRGKLSSECCAEVFAADASKN